MRFLIFFSDLKLFIIFTSLSFYEKKTTLTRKANIQQDKIINFFRSFFLEKLMVILGII